MVLQNKKKHIVQIIPTLSFGGAERVVVDIVNNASPNYKHTIILFFDNQPLSQQIKNKDVKIIVIKKYGKISLSLFNKLEEKLKELQPDIVHTHLFGADLWGRVAAKRLSIPVVTTEHTSNFPYPFLKNKIKYLLRNKTDRYIACSKDAKNWLQKSYKISKPIEVIYNAVDTKKFDQTPIKKLAKPYKFLILGRLSKEKGHKLALQALSKIPKQYDWTCTIVGNGTEENNIKNLAKKLSIQNKIKLEPATQDVPSLLKMQDVLLVPSLIEGLGIVAMEAMTAGRLVIATRVGGLPELITHKNTGLLSKANNPTSFSKQILWALKNEKKAVKIASQGQKYAKENFAIEKMVSSYEKIYENLTST